MTTTPIVSIQDGPRLTVQAMIKQPTVVPARIIKDLEQEFIVGSLLRKLGSTASGAYQYHESTPLFADDDAAVVSEFGEIPVVSGKVGERKVAFTVKRGLALKISEEMRTRNDIDAVNTQIKQIRNSMVRTWETAFLNALFAHPDVNTMAAATPWDDPASAIRQDLLDASTEIEDAAPATDTDNYFGFRPDTLVIGHATRNALLASDDFASAYTDVAVKEAPAYTGTLPGRFFNIDNIMVSREMDRLQAGSALVLQRQVIGGIGDERPLRSTPLYEHKPTETWRTDTTRVSAIVLDQPKAACIITDVLT